MIIGVVASLVYVIYRSSRPHVSSLGHVPGIPGAYADLSRHPECTPVPRVLIVRPDVPIYYANALTVRDRVKAMLEETQPPPKAIILDVSAQDDLDLTSSDVLKSLVRQLQGKGMAVAMADVHTPIREFSRKTGLLELVGEDHLFPTVDLAVRSMAATAAASTPG
jgi:SulP family sulfate permease